MSESRKPRKSKAKGGLSHRQKMFVLVLFAINACIFGGMWALSAQPLPVDYSQELAASQTMALRDAYKQALSAALVWQSDAQVVGVTTSWRLAHGDSLSLNRTAWSFSFYSPAARQVQLVTVDEQGTGFGPQQPPAAVPQAVTPDWDLDGEELLLTFLSYSGEAFLSTHPGANIHLQLKADETGRSIWSITAVDPVVRETLLVRVDARTRQVVQSESIDGGA